jgi:hypothetical protein
LAICIFEILAPGTCYRKIHATKSSWPRRRPSNLSKPTSPQKAIQYRDHNEPEKKINCNEKWYSQYTTGLINEINNFIISIMTESLYLDKLHWNSR